MPRPLYAVLLAGRIRPSPLTEALDVPVLCLPIGPCGSLLDEWLRAMKHLPGLQEVRAVVNTPAEEESVRAILRASCLKNWDGPNIRVMAEPAAWRGAAGIARDVTDDIAQDALVMVCEAKRLPPSSLQPLFEAFDACDNAAGTVGVCGSDQPAGVALFTRQAMMMTIPSIGYFDLKEQFLPALCRSGRAVAKAALDDSVWRLHDLESYLACVRHSLTRAITVPGTIFAPQNADRKMDPVQISRASRVRVSGQASISPSAVVDGCCIIEAGAVIEDGAVVHDSVVLWGATVGGGAVVTQSVIGSLATVPPRHRIMRAVVARPSELQRDYPRELITGVAQSSARQKEAPTP